MTSGRPGFALILSMLLVLALAILGMGVLAVGTAEQGVASALGRRAQAERWAEAAALQAVRGWSTRSVAALAIGDIQPASTASPGTATVERVDSTLFLVRAEGRAAGPHGGTTAVTGLLVHVLHPDRLARGFPGALNADSAVAVVGGTVDGLASCGTPGPGVVAPTVSLDPAAVVAGNPPTSAVAPPGMAPPDPFAPGLAAALADIHHPGGTATPRPAVAGGTCVADALNWGSPDPGHACHGLRPVVLAPSLVVDGGVGFGVLVVDGDLRVTGGARLDGVIVVQGRLLLDAGSTLRGTVRAGSAAVSGAVIRDGCAVAGALSAPALDRAFRPPDRWWIPLF